MNKDIKPRTKPTPEQLEQMKKEIKRLTDTFGFVPLGRALGVPVSTISAWSAKGKISAQAANDICKHEFIKKEGFTRESLRPDVKIWYTSDD